MTNFRDVLTPSQAVEMERFLITLTKGAKLCKQAGVKPDISAAMWSWGHIPKTEGEHSISNGFREREKKVNENQQRRSHSTLVGRKARHGNS